MKFLIEIPDYMLVNLLAIQCPKKLMPLDDTIHMLIAKAVKEARGKRTGESS